MIVVRPSEEIVLNGAATWNENCLSTASLRFNWTSTDIVIPEHLKNVPILRLLAYSIVPGSAINVQVTVTTNVPGVLRPSTDQMLMVPIADTATASVQVRCVREPIIAAIYGGNRVVSREGNFSLDANRSVDWEQSPLPFRYTWACALDGKRCPGVEVPTDTTTAIWTLSALELNASTSYDFTVLVTKGDRCDNQTATITVGHGLQLQSLWIIPMDNPYG